MPDITDPKIIKFTNEHIRPMAESIRNLKAYMDDAAATYTAEISGLMTGNADGDVLVDGRAGEGISVLTKADITGFINVVASIRTDLNAAGVMDTVRKPTVRPLRG